MTRGELADLIVQTFEFIQEDTKSSPHSTSTQYSESKDHYIALREEKK